MGAAPITHQLPTRRFIRSATILGLSAWLLLAGQGAAPRAPHQRPRPGDLQNEARSLADRAIALPPELAADILLRLAAAPGTLRSQESTQSLIERAFQLASHAQFPFPRVGGYWTDSQLGMVSGASPLGLDELSLKMRAVGQMLAVDAARAREMFTATPLPEWTPLSCTDPYAPKFDRYYATLLELFRSPAFSAKEREKGEDFTFIMQRLNAIDSPLEFFPGLRVALELGEPRLVDVLADVVKRLRPDPRSTMALGVSDQEVKAIAALGTRGQRLMEGYRDFLVASYGARRCSTSLNTSNGRGGLTRSIGFFNLAVRSFSEVPPITEAEVRGFRVEESFKETPFWTTSAKSRAVLSELQWLQTGDREGTTQEERRRPAEERRSLEWNARAVDLLGSIDSWKVTDEASPADYFFMKCMAYATVASLAPAGPTRSRALGQFIDHLTSAYPPADYLAWYARVADMLGTLAPEDYDFFVDALLQAPNPVLNAYAVLARVERRSVAGKSGEAEATRVLK